MTREIQEATMKIDSIQSCSGRSTFGIPPDDEQQGPLARLPGSRPGSADGGVTSSGGRVKPRHHSAPPRRGHPGNKIRSRPHTSMAYVDVVIESGSEEEQEVHPPPKPFLRDTAQQSSGWSNYISTPLGGTGHHRSAAAGAKQHQPFSAFTSRTPMRTDITDLKDPQPKEQPVPKRGLANPKTSELVKSVAKERVMAQKLRKQQMKKPVPKATTFVRPALLNLKYKNLMETKVYIQQMQQEDLNKKIKLFLDSYPRPLNKFAIKPDYLLSI